MTLKSAVERGIEALDKIYVRTGGNSQREITIAFMREILSAMLPDEEPPVTSDDMLEDAERASVEECPTGVKCQTDCFECKPKPTPTHTEDCENKMYDGEFCSCKKPTTHKKCDTVQVPRDVVEECLRQTGLVLPNELHDALKIATEKAGSTVEKCETITISRKVAEEWILHWGGFRRESENCNSLMVKEIELALSKEA